MEVVRCKDENIKKAVHLIRTAVHTHKAKLIVLPETFNTWYGREWYTDNAEIIPGGITCHTLINLCRELNIYLVCGSIIERDDRCLYNTTVVLSPTGDIVAKYRKIHLSNFVIEHDYHVREMDFLKNGNTLTTFDIEGIKIGLGIGFDLSFNEMATLYRKKGCDILIYPSVYPVGVGLWQWHQLCHTRAIDNQVFVVGASTARNDKHDYVSYGQSVVVDPKGCVVLRGHDYEEILYCELGMLKWE